MKITLDEPIEGYEEKAEYRIAECNEWMLGDDGKAIQLRGIRSTFKEIILTPKRQRAEVRRYWATHKPTGRRLQFVNFDGCANFYSSQTGWVSVLKLIDPTPIDGEFLDAQPVEKDWWTGAEKMPETDAKVLHWCVDVWAYDLASNVRPDTIWRYQPPAPSVARTDAPTNEKGGE